MRFAKIIVLAAASLVAACCFGATATYYNGKMVTSVGVLGPVLPPYTNAIFVSGFGSDGNSGRIPQDAVLTPQVGLNKISNGTPTTVYFDYTTPFLHVPCNLIATNIGTSGNRYRLTSTGWPTNRATLMFDNTNAGFAYEKFTNNGIVMSNLDYWTIDSLNIYGTYSNAGVGINLGGVVAGSRTLGVQITNCNIRTWEQGIWLHSETYSNGYDGALIAFNWVSNIVEHAIFTSYFGPDRPHAADCHRNIIIRGNKVGDVWGRTDNVPSGSGLAIDDGNCDKALIERNLVKNIGSLNGSLGGGPCCIIHFYSSNGICQFNICSKTHATPSGIDGDPIDNDLEVYSQTNRWNYVYDNDGPGLYEFSAGYSNRWSGNVFVHNGLNNGYTTHGEAWVNGNGSYLTIDNNTFISTSPGRSAITNTGPRTGTNFILNNILVIDSDASPPTSYPLAWSAPSNTAVSGNLYFDASAGPGLERFKWGATTYTGRAAFVAGASQPNTGTEQPPLLLNRRLVVQLEDPYQIETVLTNWLPSTNSPAWRSAIDSQVLYGLPPMPTDIAGLSVAHGGYNIGAHNGFGEWDFPTNFTTCVGWWEPDFTWTNSGVSVLTMKDLSGFSNDLNESPSPGTLEQGPVNGRKVITFDGTTQYMRNTTFTNNSGTALEVWVIYKYNQPYTASGVPSGIKGLLDGGKTTNRFSFSYRESTTSSNFYSTFYGATTNDSLCLTNQWMALTEIFTNGNATILTNMVALLFNTSGVGTNMEGVALGNTGATNSWGPFSVRHVSLYTNTPANLDADRSRKWSMLMKRFGVP